MSLGTRCCAVALGIALLALLASSGCGGPTGLGDVSGLRLGAFASDRGNAAGQFDIYLWDYDARQFKGLSALNSSVAERHPSLSSDGRFIALQADRGTGTLADILMYDRQQAKFLDLPGLNTVAPETEPVFTGDGLKLCFVQGSTVRRIRMYDGQKRQLIPLPGVDTTGATYSDWSPAPNRDGSLIAFVSDRGGNIDIWIYDRTRSQLIDIPELRSPADDLDPCFTPNGRFLAFSSNRAPTLGGYDLFLLEFVPNPADTLLRDVSAANSPLDERHPSVSETGNIIVFQSNRVDGQGKWDVWNYDRTALPGHNLGQADGYDSPGDDIEPSIKWPY